MTPKIPPLSLSPGLEEEIAVVTEVGLYESEEAFLVDAVRTFLAARPDVRETVACRLYEKGVFSLGQAAEWSGVSIEDMKLTLHRRGIVRQAPEAPTDTAAMARATLEAAGRTAP